MAETITLTLPERLDDSIRRMAQATQQPVESLLVSALQASLPSLDGLPQDLTQELVSLETLDIRALWHVLAETMDKTHAQELEELLHHKQAGVLSPSQAQRLDELQRAADRVMLRKARAAVLLRFRGQRIPTLGELGALPNAI